LPFWIDRAPDPDLGGFLTYFDGAGRPTGETAKTFLMQVRTLYTMASAHRAGYGGGRCAELAHEAARFLIDHYWDDEHGGWYWSADRHGRPTSTGKIGYGQCFAMYTFGEYHLATGVAEGRDAMERTLAVVEERMVDRERGGYFEIMQRDFQPERPGRHGGDRKSFDVHMHMMEALTKVFEVTGDAAHRARLVEVIDLIVAKMLDPTHGTGIQQFSLDFEPLPSIEFDVRWGRDADAEAKPIDVTSYGHNVEFAWLLQVAAVTLGMPSQRYADVCTKLYAHCLRFGIDAEYGGVYIEGKIDAVPADREKQFWQQAEVMVGMLDAWTLLGDPRYFDAFENVHAFVFDKFVNLPAGGEWRALVDREGAPVWDYLGDAWKINYHTVRAMIEVVRRLTARLETV
jgi:mannobiose 2-epimerase